MTDGVPLFDDEIEAWQYGPAIPGIYQRYKHLRAGAIPRPEGYDDTKLP